LPIGSPGRFRIEYLPQKCNLGLRDTPRVKRSTKNTDLSYDAPVTAKDDAIASLRDSGILDVLTWAAPAAFAATGQIYDEDAGHDQAVVGYLNYKHLKDLMDRATSNGRFAIGDDADGTGSDVLQRGITPEVYQSMPSVTPGAIARNDYHQSPGWAADGYRVLLQSYKFGQVDEISWVLRSEAKRQVASQFYIDEENTLFDAEDFGLELIGGIPDDDAFVGVTLVAAHALNLVTAQFELYVGQSKNPAYRGDSCWHWSHKLLSGGTPLGGMKMPVPPVMPGDGATTDVEDVPVRIKKALAGEGSGMPNE